MQEGDWIRYNYNGVIYYAYYKSQPARDAYVVDIIIDTHILKDAWIYIADTVKLNKEEIAQALNSTEDSYTYDMLVHYARRKHTEQKTISF